MRHTLGIRCLKLLKLSKADFSQCRANTNKWAPVQLTDRFSNELQKSEAVNILQGRMMRFIADTLSEVHITKKCSVYKETYRLVHFLHNIYSNLLIMKSSNVNCKYIVQMFTLPHLIA